MTRLRFHILWVLIAFVGCVGVALVLRPQARPSLWTDEVYSLMLSRGLGYAERGLTVDVVMEGLPSLTSLEGEGGSVFSVWVRQAEDAHPPLYFVGLRVWRDVFGDSVGAARGLSVVLHLGTLGVVMWALRGAGVAAVAAGGLAFGMSAVGCWYGQEIRGYVMAEFFLAVVLLGQVRLLGGGGDRWRWVWGVGAVGAMLTHYYSAGVLLGLVGGAVVWTRGRVWESEGVRRVGVAAVGAVVVFAGVWGFWLVRQFSAAAGFSGWMVMREPFSVLKLGSIALSVPTVLLGGPNFMATTTGAVLLGVGVWYSRKSVAVCAGVSGVVGLCLFLWAVDGVRGTVHLWQVRYLVPGLPAVAVMVGGLAGVPGVARFFAVAAVLVAGLSQLEPRSSEADWNYVVVRVREVAGGEKIPLVLAVDGGPTARDVETSAQLLALMFTHHSGGWDGPVVLLDGPASAGTLADLRRHGKVVFVTAWRHADAVTFLPGFVPEAGATVPAMGVGVTRLVPGEKP